jgi:hypothetical protein
MNDKNKRLNTTDGLLKAWRSATGTDAPTDAHQQFLSSLEQAKLRAKHDVNLAKWREASLFGKSPAVSPETEAQDEALSLFDEGEGEA